MTTGAVCALSLAALPLSTASAVQTLAPHQSTTTAPAVKFGASVESASNLTALTNEYGHLPLVRVYYPGLPPSTTWTTGLAAVNKSAAIVSFKALPSTILSGADDAALTTFFKTAPTTHRVYYSYYHEPEDNIAAGQFTLSSYKAAWQHIVALQKAVAPNNSLLTPTLILMEYDLQPYSGRTWTNYIPANHIIKVVGWDAYPNGGVNTPSPSTFMAPAAQASEKYGISFGFAEFGTTTISGRPAWLSSIGSYCKSSGAVFCSLYDSTYNGGLGGSGTFVLTDSASQQAWHNVVNP